MISSIIGYAASTYTTSSLTSSAPTVYSQGYYTNSGYTGVCIILVNGKVRCVGPNGTINYPGDFYYTTTTNTVAFAYYGAGNYWYTSYNSACVTTFSQSSLTANNNVLGSNSACGDPYYGTQKFWKVMTTYGYLASVVENGYIYYPSSFSLITTSSYA